MVFITKVAELEDIDLVWEMHDMSIKAAAFMNDKDWHNYEKVSNRINEIEAEMLARMK